MTRDELLQLQANAYLTPQELTASQPALAKLVEARLLSRVHASAQQLLADAPAPLKALASTLPLSLAADAQSRSVRDAVITALSARAHDVATRTALDTFTRSLDEPAVDTTSLDTTVGDLVGADLPIAGNPEFVKELAQARVYTLADAAALPTTVATVLSDAIGDVASIDERRLTALVTAGKLSDDDARRAGRAVALYGMLDERPELVARVAKGLDGKGLADVRSLAKIDDAGWTRLVTESGATPPAGLTPAAWAKALGRKARALFPADALAARLAAGPRTLDALRVRYPGMKLDQLVDDKKLDDVARTAEAARRAALVDTFLAKRADALALDLTARSPSLDDLSFDASTTAADRLGVLATVRAYQRAFAAAGDIDVAGALVTAGYHSALTIAVTPVDAVRTATGLDADGATALRERARTIASSVGAAVGSVIEIVQGPFGGLNVNNVQPAVIDYLKEIPGFDDFFGAQAYCSCKHCQSILGPAAYFVDLMGYVDRTITVPAFAGQAPSHPLRLKVRRPDLWTLDLTCDNTNTPIPYLTIINEVLENAVATELGYAGQLNDRTAVERVVYHDGLPDREDSFIQPFHLPFEVLTTYLRHFQTPLADLAEAGGAPGDTLARLRLALAPHEFRLIIESRTTLPELRHLYGYDFTATAGTIDQFDAQELVRASGLSRGEVGELVATSYVTAQGFIPIKIVPDKRSAQSVQNDVEWVKGATAVALDRLQRIVRLRRAAGWRTGELDLAITTFEGQNVGNGLAPAVVDDIARLVRLGVTLGASPEDLIAFVGPMPTRPVTTLAALTADQDQSDEPTAYPAPAPPLAYLTRSLFDRVFNPPGVAGGAYPQDTTRVLHPALATAAAPAVNPHLTRLKVATGTDDQGLYQLLVGLARPLGLDLDSASDTDRSVALSARNLGLLYRHARLARVLGVTIEELVVLAAIDTALPLGFIDSVDDLESLISTRDWWRTTRWTVDQLVLLLRPTTPAVAVSRAAVTGAAAGATVTYSSTTVGAGLTTETITFGADANIDAVVTDWNAQAQTTVMYRADARGAVLGSGTFLAVRTRGGAARPQLTITADSAGMFTATPPRIVRGRQLPVDPVDTPASAADTAAQLVATLASQNRLTFTDTIFALMPPTPATLASRNPLAGTAGGETVTVTVTLNGTPQAAETITLHAHGSLADVIADWNAQASTTVAVAAGTRLGIQAVGGAGGDTQLLISADSAGLFAATPPVSARGVEITPDQSRAILLANAADVEPAGTSGRLRLTAAFDPATALALPAGIDPSLEPLLRSALLAYHGEAILLSELPSVTGVAPARLRAMIAMLGTPLGTSALFMELRGDTVPPAGLTTLIDNVSRLALLFADAQVFADATLAFVMAQAARFAIQRFDQITQAAATAVDAYRLLLANPPGTDPSAPPVNDIVTGFDPVNKFAAVDPAALARVLGLDQALTQSLTRTIPMGSVVFPALDALARAGAVAQRLGVAGELFGLVQSTDYDTIAQAGAAMQAALRSKYSDDTAWHAADDPFQDRLLSRRRDGLVAWLINSSAQPFAAASDLYHYYLLDVLIEGCARTSRVAAAIDTVQLYVRRCQLNLEESPANAPNPVHVLPGLITDTDWEFRSHYRVWEASRKIFLTPENYIEPELRDDKTPLFQALEDELSSKEITEEAILDAYARYLRGFDELAHLAIAGTYHEKDETTKLDVLHIVGCTADDPPVFYYRHVENAEAGVSDATTPTQWNAWEKLDVQIPVRKVSPIVHQGQLYVFWVRYTTRSLNELKGGESLFSGYQHRMMLEFTRRRVDGTWTSAQRVKLTQSPFDARGDGVVLDPIVPKGSIKLPILWLGFMNLYTDFQPLYDDQIHEVPKDDYTLRGFMWDVVFPSPGDDISLRGANFQMWSTLDLYRLEIGPQILDFSQPAVGVPYLNPSLFLLIWLFSGFSFDPTKLLPPRLVWTRPDPKRRPLFRTPAGMPCFDTYTYAYILSDQSRIAHYEQPLDAATTKPQWDPTLTNLLRQQQVENPIGDISPETSLDVVNGSVGDVILQTLNDAFYLQEGARTDGRYYLRRLGSSVSGDIADILYRQGLATLLTTATQNSLGEHGTDVNVVASEVFDATVTNDLDFDGSVGVYLREIFFHIPFLIASYFNSQGDFELARKWYHVIFDPTSTETIAIPAGTSAEDRARLELDRVWRYREFRGLKFESLRDLLTNPKALGAYHLDPLNPYAIARVRLSAYQKAVVMKYVDNLIDWGDQLFALAYSQLDQEYLREATEKYDLAESILGGKPVTLGDCGEGLLSPKTYANIVAQAEVDSEFLSEIESVTVSTHYLGAVVQSLHVEADPQWVQSRTLAIYGDIAAARPPAPVPATPVTTAAEVRQLPAAARRAAIAGRTLADSALAPRPKANGQRTGLTIALPAATAATSKQRPGPNFTIDIVTQIGPLFCVPGNDVLAKYRDRADLGLYRIRHCMDPDGNVRPLPLWAPPIDPGLLARLGAAGLTLDDVLQGSGGDVPPYRFQFLIEKARQYAATLQGLGAALLGALDRRDNEELTRIRNVHIKNILALTTDLRTNELSAAAEGVEIAMRRQTVAQYRKTYYSGLVDGGLSPAEVTQEIARGTASVLRGAAAIADTVSAIAHLVPQVGSPFSMKFGGLEVGMSATSWAQLADRVATVADSTATIAGIVSGYERRAQGWAHQRDLADHDLKVADRDLVLAQVRQAMAQRGLDLHEQNKDQHDEIMEFYESRFTSITLFRTLARSLQQLHRDAYTNALALAQLAQRAYRYERPGDTQPFIGGEWDASRSGLQAGERLLLGLQRMERRFLETHTRTDEINQTFSVAQIDPEALVSLKESGSCTFTLPELFFDLFYPGQYRRRIRAVRLSIPCITGPYTNVGARLTLAASAIRHQPQRGAALLQDVTRNQTISVAMSTAQGDGGVFELNFRDERYMPFEGAGAVSSWQLDLPRNFRPFDYQTITDVLINVSFAADYDPTLRDEIDTRNAALEGSVLQVLRNQSLTRVLSLRQEFSMAFNRLVQGPAGTPVTIDITDRHLPLFLRARPIAVSAAQLILVTGGRVPAGAAAFTVNGVTANAFPNPTNPPAAGDVYGGLASKTVTGAFGGGLRNRHTIIATNAGALASTAGAGGPMFDPDLLTDVLLAVDYRLS